MKRVLVGLHASLVAAAFLASCSGSNSSTPSGADGGRSDGGKTTRCGGSGEVCCDGDACENGFTCHAGRCSAAPGVDSGSDANSGVDGGRATKCVVGGTTYASGAANPTNACESCQPLVASSAWSDLADGADCGTAGICHTGACVSGCEIGSVYYATAAANPNDACQTCQPGKSRSSWTDVGVGAACGNGQVCQHGKCGTQCDIGGTLTASEDTNPDNACQLCDPGTSTTAWTTMSPGTACASKKVCNGTNCVSGCSIGGFVYPAGTVDPADACQVCDPTTSTTAWTAAPIGTSCGSGQVCNGTSCTPGCFIGGSFYVSGAADPKNACESCQPGTSATAWSTSADGTGCANGGTCTSGACVQPPSCAAALTGSSTCGRPSGSCCASLEVAGGTFDREYTIAPDGGGAEDGGGSFPASVSGFRLDKYEVTVGRFRQYVDYLTSSIGAPPANGSGKHTHLNGGQGLLNVDAAMGVTKSKVDAGVLQYETGWDAVDWDSTIPTGTAAAVTWQNNLACDANNATWTNGVAGQATDSMPINCVDWFEAYAFCIWDGGFLPSEAEWVFAAAGGSQEREYPWGSTDPGDNDEYAIYGCKLGSNDDAGDCLGGNVAQVGTTLLGVGLSGQLDLAGNVAEWTLDSSINPYVVPSADGAYLAAATTSAGGKVSTKISRMVHGGSFEGSVSDLLPMARRAIPAQERQSETGFRCARTP